MKKTLYDILGVSRDAAAEEIAAAYRQRLDELKNAPSASPVRASRSRSRV